MPREQPYHTTKSSRVANLKANARTVKWWKSIMVDLNLPAKSSANEVQCLHSSPLSSCHGKAWKGLGLSAQVRTEDFSRHAKYKEGSLPSLISPHD